MAKELGISFDSVARIWRDNDLLPWKRETFKFSTDPELDANVRDVSGLYLNPPEKAVGVCVDEKTQIQALDRTAPILRYEPGYPRRPPATTSATAPPAQLNGLCRSSGRPSFMPVSSHVCQRATGLAHAVHRVPDASGPQDRLVYLVMSDPELREPLYHLRPASI